MTQHRLPSEILQNDQRQPESTDDFPNAMIDPEQTRPAIPWWRLRPSPALWLLVIIPFTSIASSAKEAPRIDIYTQVACAAYKPELGTGISLHEHTCRNDPIVQAAVAKLIGVLFFCTGVLSFSSTGYWGAYSDRHGRIRVLAIYIVGNLLEDLNFILVTRFLPGYYWFLIVGAVMRGFLGGFPTGMAVIHAYLADTTDEHDRSRVLSLSVGLLFTGVSLGPTFGSFLLRATGKPISVFYGAAILYLLYFTLIYFFLPESATELQMIQARAKYYDETTATDRTFTAVLISSFLTPLALFLPSGLNGSGVGTRQKRDWSLTLLAIAYGFTTSIFGSHQNKLQYAASEFGWSTEMIGYWLSMVGVTRAIALILILPVGIKTIKKMISTNSVTVSDSGNPSEVTPLLDPSGESASSSIRGTRSNIGKEMDPASFDLGLARCFVMVDIVSAFCMALSRTGWQFTIFTVVGAFGMGFPPAAQSVTLALYIRRGGVESGRFFGALSVVQALSTQMLGPPLYSFVYAKTVGTFPRAIFFLTVFILVISFVLLLFVKLPDNKALPDTQNDAGH